jgi:UDP-glucose 4-epimerase
MEYLCDLYRANFGLDTVGLRYFTVFGPRQRPDMAFHRICRAAIEGSEFTVFGDGRQTRDFSFVDDIVASTRAAAAAELGEDRVFNIGGGSPASLRDAIDLISGLATRSLNIRYEEAERGDVRDTAADTTLAREVLGYAPTGTLRGGLEAEFRWMLSELGEPQ